MGNRFEILLVAENETWAHRQIDLAIEEIKRIEKLLTTYDESSQTNAINAHAGQKAIVVDKEVFELIKRSIKISNLTDGAFDITYGSIDKRLWNFDTSMQQLPDKKKAKQSVRLINYKNIVLDENRHSVFLKEAGMRIGFGGIGKGYAAEMAKLLMIKNGVKSGIINASGDLAVWGNQANNAPWTIGIINPDYKNLPFSYLSVSNMAVATSGNYEKFILIGHKKYSHTINPKTGLPISGIKSVTVICPNAEFADALATPIAIMGVQTGLQLVNQLNKVECVIVDDFNNLHHSNGIQLKYNAK